MTEALSVSGRTSAADTFREGGESERLDEAIGRAARLLLSRQAPDGHWAFDLEADATIPSEYLLLQRFLGRRIPARVRDGLLRGIRRRQLPDGGWPLYEGGPADISASVKAYLALKISGDPAEARHMRRARSLVLSAGGASRANVFTRIALALFGQLPWRLAPAMPVEIVRLPGWFPFHLRKVSCWSRTVIVPLLVLYARKPVCRLEPRESVPELFAVPPGRIRHIDGFVPGRLRKNAFVLLDRLLKRADRLAPRGFREGAVDAAERWMRERMGEGGIGAIFPAMANAVMALKTLGCPADDPDYARGIRALDGLLRERGDEWLCQPCVSPVWDTALAVAALAEAGLSPRHEAVASGVRWLLARQVNVRGDWSARRPELAPAAWAFQYENAFYPDVDDTAMVLLALLCAAPGQERCREPVDGAVRWILGMQGSSGGWGAFDVDNDALFLNDIPFADHGALLDPPTSDVTGRCVALLGDMGRLRSDPAVDRAIRFLRSEQEADGSWYGRWGVNHVYGTWAVLMGLRRAGEDMSLPYVRRAVEWIVRRQNPDGGWGESCRSYEDPGQAGKGESTASQTAWALLALMDAGEVRGEAVRRGIAYLLGSQEPGGGWEEKAFTGTGFPRVFYLRYHGYRLFFPLWALGTYRRLRSRESGGARKKRSPRPFPRPAAG